MITVENVNFSYEQGELSTPVLKNLSLSIPTGSLVAIEGKSGSGKSTLFHLLGGLLKPTSGRIQILGKDITALSSDELALFRNESVGFVFQQFHLLARATVLENILLPSLYPCENRREGDFNKLGLLAAQKVGMEHRLSHLPNQLSGGEQQRVVIARALLNEPHLILADEPTGNLDTANAEMVLTLLKELHQQGKTVILITHDPQIADQCQLRFQMKDGLLISSHHQQNLPKREIPPSPAADIERKPIAKFLPNYLQLLKTILPLALENLRRNKIRAALTMVGVSVGIAAVFSMLSFGQFAQEKVMKGYEEMGANTVMIRGYDNWLRKATDVTGQRFQSFKFEEELLPLKTLFPQIARLSPILNSWRNSAHFSGRTIENDVMIFGVNEQALTLMNRKISKGRAFTPYHISSISSVCLIGSDIDSQLFQSNNQQAVGNILFMSSSDGKSFPCQIIGVLAPQTSNKDWRKPNSEVYLPFTYFSSVSAWWEAQIHSFSVQFKPGTDIERSAKGVRRFFERKYGASGKFMVDSDTMLLSQMKRAFTLFTLLLTTIALITLGVGGMGINNMMLVSVAERLKEIGLRKALGATGRSIRTQFILESTCLSLIAGLLGVIFGFVAYELVIFAASQMISKLPFEWILKPFPLLLSCCSMLVVGICSGVLPAIKAEKLQVVEALRSE